MPKMNFSNIETRNVFESYDYNDVRTLMFETAVGKEKVSTEQANDKIREVMFSVLGVEPDCTRKELHKAIRKHKIDVFEVIEETVEDLLVSGWGSNPFFNEFVEIKSLNDGDTNEFYTKDRVILTVSKTAGNHHDLTRQKLGAGTSFSVKTSWYSIKIYAEYELFMAGRVDWASFVAKIYEAFDKEVNDTVYSSVMAAGSKLPTTNSQWVKTGALNSTNKDTFMTLLEDVQSANGCDIVIMGTKSALAKLNGMEETTWISDSMKEARYSTGRLGLFEGVRLVEIPQAFAANDTTTKLVDNTKLLVMPVADNRFVKIFNEGESQVKEVSDGTTNLDGTMEYEYQQKMGVATVIGRLFGMWTITA